MVRKMPANGHAPVRGGVLALPTIAGDCTDCGKCEKRCVFSGTAITALRYYLWVAVSRFDTRPFSCYINLMTITQTVEILADRRVVLEVPREVPTGSVILSFTAPASAETESITEKLNGYYKNHSSRLDEEKLPHIDCLARKTGK